MRHPLFIRAIGALASSLREDRLPRGKVATYGSVSKRLDIPFYMLLNVIKAVAKSRIYPLHRIVPARGIFTAMHPPGHLEQLREEGHRITELENGTARLEDFCDHWADALPPAQPPVAEPPAKSPPKVATRKRDRKGIVSPASL